MQPLTGVRTMLELGNKFNGQINRSYKDFFESHGIKHTSVDWNGKDGALKLDLRKPINLGTFDMVTNIGTTEHVSEQEPVWRNICEALAVGSILCSITPTPGHWCWHGEHYPSDEFYRALCRLNGLELQRLHQYGQAPRVCTAMRAVRVADVEFVMPDSKLIIKNVMRRYAP